MSASASVTFAGELLFNRDIRPILSENCFACHGTDAKKRKGDLRLDEETGAKAALEEGRVAIKSGDPAGSELWKRINETDPDEVMPPPKTHKTLSAEQKETL
jgi:mono/diheme cytochrome c family protein